MTGQYSTSGNFEYQITAALARTTAELDNLSRVVASLGERMLAQEALEQRHPLLCPYREAISTTENRLERIERDMDALYDTVQKLDHAAARNGVVVGFVTAVITAILTTAAGTLLGGGL